MKYSVGILLFNEVEVLDFAGPFEVFSITTIDDQGTKGFDVFTISQNPGAVSARNGLKVLADKRLTDVDTLDILIVPGGYGAEKIEIHNTKVLEWIARISTSTKITASVCTGAFLLAKAGLLKGLNATTHWMDLDDLETNYPDITVCRNVNYVDNGHFVTSAGISAGIEMSLHLVNRLFGKDIALKTAKRMEYRINPDSI